MRRDVLGSALAVGLLAAACAPASRLPALSQNDIEAETRLQQIAHIRKYYSELHRVDTIAFRIRTANRADCHGWESAQIGLHAATPQSLPSRYRSYSREALDLTWARPTVISVVEGSPAAGAGITIGDQIIALNGELIPVTGTAGWMAGWLKHHGAKPLQANLRRDGVDRTVTITPVMGCAIPIVYMADATIDAATDGDRIIIHSGMVMLAKSDAQLAHIIGHELAHANLGHLDKRLVNTVAGWVGGTLIDAGFLSGGISTGGAFRKEFAKAGARAFSVNFEREADYVGAYYAARAGYDMAGAEEFWRELGLAHPDSIRFARTHPITAVRFLQLKKVAAEIADKRGRNLPLMPELKSPYSHEAPRQSFSNSGNGL
ncbi:MAG: M48 family metallopeptidase [Pseudolabrys sp.]|nr:M48 family metallopeptidase [Pseudolabrys sp.]MDP2297621.1 M48 family metallopeptidase [Pseudolabrys sp.]